MQPLVGLIMGSKSDWETMSHAAQTLETLGVPFEVRVLSAHRTPDQLFEYVETADGRGLEVIVAAAGGAAHLAGVAAAKTSVAGARRAYGVEVVEGVGLSAVDGSDARGHTGGHACDWPRRRSQCRALCGCDTRNKTSRGARGNQEVSREPGAAQSWLIPTREKGKERSVP